MDLGGTFAKRFEMIKHACHFKRTLLMVLVFEAMGARVWCGVTGIYRLCPNPRQHPENLSH